ncbi:RraA family protein [Roseitalea porphyridii]|uniref:Putative 4-hydroxy-4-methyl-2-oxoglutarate aldolase n=1 Tax=Roseitalea porphyridii TaxID=1852022 RepID=A0A4P6V020_9HYPH|nr:RraA family protein [Roseitalea porphyridii]QBK30737.1 RraA family protein [Roseitalea porphyridii]
MSEMPTTVQEAIEACRRELYAAVLSDTLDRYGLYDQSPRGGLRLLDVTKPLCGLARVGIYMPVYHDDEALDVYGEEIDLVDSLQPNEVPVLACHGLTHIAPWGELLSTRAQVLKAGGFVTDGSVRDARMIRAMGFPVVCSGTTPVDTKYRGKLALYDVPGRIGGVDIASGDLVFADEDGMVVVPAARILMIVGEALSKVRAETTVRNELAAGETLRDIFTRHRIL